MQANQSHKQFVTQNNSIIVSPYIKGLDSKLSKRVIMKKGGEDIYKSLQLHIPPHGAVQ